MTHQSQHPPTDRDDGPASICSMTTNKWIGLAKQRTIVRLADGREAALVGVEKRSPRARIEFFDGTRRTISLASIAHVEPVRTS